MVVNSKMMVLQFDGTPMGGGGGGGGGGGRRRVEGRITQTRFRQHICNPSNFPSMVTG